MAVGASVTWTHYSVLFEVTWGKIVRVRTYATMHPRGHRPDRADELTSLPSPSLSLPPLPPPLRTQSAIRGDARNFFNCFLNFLNFLNFIFFGSCCRFGKRYNL
jgi:hypothetical protein